jgi:rhodanese-related sulfurtransferase
MNFLSRLLRGSQSGADALELEPTDVKMRQDAGSVLIDVREPDEWQAGRVPGATHIPLGQLQTRLSEIPLDREVLLICRSGNRSGAAQRLLLANGYHQAVNVAGGMSAWERARLPVER